MVEYGGGINNGPAGQVGGGGGTATSGDFFAAVGGVVNDTANFISAQPPEVLILAVLIAIVGLVILKRAF